MDDPTAEFDFEAFLKSDELASLYNANRTRAPIFRITGSLSTIASICIIIHILRSHQGLSTTYHRMVFGLSIGDILLSFFGFVLGSVMVPRELDYINPFARGNQATCDAQGFLSNFGASLGLSYNMSICWYYLAIVTFNKTDEFIQTKVEPWLHAISILVPLAGVCAILAIDGFNSSGGNCWFVPNNVLPHCTGLESGEIRDGFTVPCGRGDGRDHPTLYSMLRAYMLIHPLLTPTVIFLTMGIMYRSVRQVERKMQRYGAGALRLRNNHHDHRRRRRAGNGAAVVVEHGSSSPSAAAGNQTSTSGDDDTTTTSFFHKFKSQCRKIFCFHTWCNTNKHTAAAAGRRRSNATTSQKRAILHRATGYVVAWALSWMPFVLILVIRRSPALLYILAFLNPIQGVFNFIAYMHPKIIGAKRGKRRTSAAVRINDAENGPDRGGRQEIGWCRAFAKAYMSRGERRRRRRGSQPQRSRSANHTGSILSWSTVSIVNIVPNVVKKLKKVPSLFSRRSMKTSNSIRQSKEANGAANKEQKEIQPFQSPEEEEEVILEGGPPKNGEDSKTPLPTSLNIGSNAPPDPLVVPLGLPENDENKG